LSLFFDTDVFKAALCLRVGRPYSGLR